MSKKFSNFKRVMTMLLVIVMIVGMLPMAASADPPATSPGVGAGTGGLTRNPDPPKPGDPTSSGGYSDDKFADDQGRFTRYTLVRFNFSDETPDTIPASRWANEGEVVGSIDVLTDGTVAEFSGISYFKSSSGGLSNAFSYRKGDNVTLVSGYTGVDLFGDLPAYPTSHKYQYLRYTGGDPLMCKLGTEVKGVNANATMWAPNSTFNEILRRIVASTSNDTARTELEKPYNPQDLKIYNGTDIVSASTLSATEAENFKYTYNFIASAALNRSCYRVLAEPGVITNIPVGTESTRDNPTYTLAAVTLRDIASVLLTEKNGITCGNTLHNRGMMCWRDYKPSHGAEWRVEEYNGEMVYIGAKARNKWVGSEGVLKNDNDSQPGVYDFWFILKTFYTLQRQAFGMYNLSNAFRTYVFSEDSEGNATNFVFNSTPDSQAFFRGVSNEKANEFTSSWSFDNTERYKYSCYSIAQYILNIYKHGDGMLGWGEGRGTGFSGRNIPVYKEDSYPAMGLGIIEPGSMRSIIKKTEDTITIKKIIGNGLDKNGKWEFKLSVLKSGYESVCNADVGVSIVDEDGSSVPFTVEGDNMVYSFELGNEESRTFTVKIPNEDLADTVRGALVWTIEEVAAKELLEANEGIEDEDERFSVSINDVPDDDGIIDGVPLGTTTVFKNEKGPPPEGKLHVIVDYNFPNAYASSDPGEPNDLTKENMLDCGVHKAGEVVDLTLVAGGTALANEDGTKIEPVKGCTFTFRGLSTKPDSVQYQHDANNGKILGHDGNVYHYQLPTDVGDEKLLILYVVWDLKVEPEKIIIKPDDPEPVKSNVYTVYWDLGSGFDGGGITSQTCGEIVIPALDLTATASCGCGTGTANAQRAKIKIDFGFDPPTIYHGFEYYRLGHYFAGWLNTDMEAEVYNYNKYVSDCKHGGGVVNVHYSNNELVPGSTMLMNGTEWLDHITDSPEAPGKSTTFCAVWVPYEYSFDANGGYFVPTADDNYDADWYGEFPNCCGTATVTGLLKFTVPQMMGQTYHAYYIPRREPIRVGYTFTGWYWDPSCTIPVDRNEDGMMPGRVFFAGWEAEPVYVTYYDTREGNNVVTIQEYKYDDRLNRADNMASTIGWDFSRWATADNPGAEFPDATILDYSCLEAHENRYPDGEAGNDMLAGIGTGPNNNGAGAGVVSGKHYWTLDLYSMWNQEYADYVATFNFNDYNNNDGARPKKITVGVVDSITNREVASTEVDLTVNGRDTAQSFSMPIASNLAMTNNNSSTERVKYYMYLKDYTDIDNNKYIIQNTSASTGEIALASVSNADTSPVASYRYTINQVNMQGNVTDQPNLAPDDTSVTHDNNGVYTGVMYFDHNLMTTGDDIEFTIRWNDNSNQDGMRPETLKLTLMGKTADGAWAPVQSWNGGNGQLHQSNSGIVYVNSGICDVSSDGNVWTYIFKDFQKYDNKKYIQYAVRVEGYEEYSYTARDAAENGNEDGIVLDYTPVTASVPVDIYWHDNANQDGMRPDSVLVALVAHQWNRDLGAYESVTVRGKRFTGFSSSSNVWSSSFDNMPVYHDGEPIIYHLVVASDLNGNMDADSNPYTWSEGIVGNPYKDGARPSVDIYHNADERSVTATVQWDDNGNQDGMRPDSVTLQLYANNEPVPGDEYTVVLTGDPKALTWTYTFDHLDVYTEGRSGKEIVYKVKILDAQGGEFESYTPSYINKNGAFVETFAASGEAFVLMSYKPKTGTVSGAVYWQDDNNRDGQRPDFVTVALHASAFDDSTGEWIDYVAATKTIRSDEVNAMTADEWRFEFENMPVYRGSQPITYYIEITSDLNGNTDETALLYGWNEKDRGDMASDPELEVSVTVYQGVETISVTATVEWDDDNNNDGLRPNAVQLQLYADNVRVAGEAYTVTLYGNPTDDIWTHTFEHLPRYASGASGKEINYTIYAAELKDYDLYGMYDEIGRDGTEYRFVKYEDWYPANDEGGLTNALSESVDSYVTLIHKNNEIEVPFSIVWKDENNRDAQRPDYVSVSLMAYQWNATQHTWEVTEKATATVPSDEVNTMTADEWTGTFGKQEMYHDGIKIIYHLSVTSDLNAYIPQGSFEYGWIESAYGNQLDAVPQVTVSQNINTVTVPATVYWDDNGNNDGIRPTNIVLQLYAHEPGGTPVPVAGQAYRVNLTGDPKADNWNYTFSGMPKYAEGQSGVELIYTVQAIEAEGEPLYGYYIITANGEEEEVLRYEASYLYENPETGVTENSLDPVMSDRAYVRLKHISETQTMVFSANWHDSDDRDGIRPVNVSADLYKTVGDGEPV